jgi:hypothetical protein
MRTAVRATPEMRSAAILPHLQNKGPAHCVPALQDNDAVRNKSMMRGA